MDVEQYEWFCDFFLTFMGIPEICMWKKQKQQHLNENGGKRQSNCTMSTDESTGIKYEVQGKEIDLNIFFVVSI